MKRIVPFLLLAALCLPVLFESCKKPESDPATPAPGSVIAKDSTIFVTVYVGCAEPGGKKGLALVYIRQEKRKGDYLPAEILGADYMRFSYTSYTEIYAALQTAHSALMRSDPVLEKYKSDAEFWEDMFKSKPGFVKRQALSKEQATTLIEQTSILLASQSIPCGPSHWTDYLASALTALVSPVQAQASVLVQSEGMLGYGSFSVGVGVTIAGVSLIAAGAAAAVGGTAFVLGGAIVAGLGIGLGLASLDAIRANAANTANNIADRLNGVFSGNNNKNGFGSPPSAGGTRADPIIAGLDGAVKFLHPAGEFWAIRAKNDEFAAQIRFEPVGQIETANASTTTSLAIRTGKDVVSFTVKPLAIHVNGQPIRADFTETYLLQDRAFMSRPANNRYELTTTWGDLIEVRVNPTFNIYWYVRNLNDKRRNQVEGMLGQYNGNPDDDYQDKSGKIYKDSTPRKEWYDSFANDWRITQTESVLVYPAGKTTESYTFRDFPRKPISLFDFDLVARDKAEQVCRKAGIIQEPDLSNCMTDVLLTGMDEMADQQALGFKLKAEKRALFGRQSEFPGQSREGAITLAVGNRIFAGLGIGQSDWYEYEPVADKWTKRADFAGSTKGIYGTAPFVIGQKIYLTGGVNGADNARVSWLWEYDVATDAWTKRKDVPGAARFNMAGFATEGKGYVVFGTSGWGLSESDYPEKSATYQYDPSANTWSKKTDFPAKPRGSNIADRFYNGTVLTFNGRPFVGGGGGSNTVWVDWFEYKPATNTWGKRADNKNYQTGNFQFSVGNVGYLFKRGAASSSIYDAATDTWTLQEDVYFPGSTANGATQWPAVVNGRAYFGLGLGTNPQNPIKEWWSFSPGQ